MARGGPEKPCCGTYVSREPSLAWLARVGVKPSIVWWEKRSSWVGWRQAGSEMARSRTRAVTNWVSQGRRLGGCKVSWWALRVILPAREGKRRRRV